MKAVSMSTADKLKDKGFKSLNLVEQIANFVELAILDGSFEMGHQLIEQELSEHFKTSRQPIREAFRVLEKRGLVTVESRRGAFVTTITWADFEQFFPVIAALDGVAGSIVYSMIEEKTLQELDGVIVSLEAYAKNRDVRKYLVSHGSFHSILNNATHNNILIDTLTSIRTAHSWFIMTHMEYSDEQYKSSIAYHKRIVKELRRKTIGESGMESLMREHLLMSRTFYQAYFGGNS